MEAVFALADRISVLVYGRVIATGKPDEIRVNPEVRRAYLGEQEVVTRHGCHSADALLEVDNIETCYGLSQVLFGLSLKIAPGEMVTLMGRNGMGKTTTVRSIMGLTPARAGAIRFDGQDIRGLPAYRVAKLGVGLVPEGRQIFPNLSTRENLVATAANRSDASDPWTFQIRLRTVSAAGGTPRQYGRAIVRRRAADARDRARADDQSAPAHSR